MLNWIPKEERLPTKEDLSEAGYLYGVTESGVVTLVHLDHLKTVVTSFTHWLPFREMPLPKRWRTPTINDLAKAGKPIPCRVKVEFGDWQMCELRAIDISNIDKLFYWCGSANREVLTHWYKFCEICDE